MTTTHTFDHTERRIICKPSGNTNGDEFLSATRQAYDCLTRLVAYDCRYYEPYNKVVDCTELQSADVSPDVLRSLAVLDSEYLCSSRIAVVGSSLALSGADTLYAIFVEVMGSAVEVCRFGTHHEAERWLTRSPNFDLPA
jgi:hypothetical protein